MSTTSSASENLLLFRNTSWHKDLSPEEIEQHSARFTAWFARLRKEGQFKAGGPLLYDGKFVAGSKKAVLDGSFAESKEAIAGFLIIRADSLEQAVKIAKGCSSLEFGQTVEVRAIRFDSSSSAP